MIICDNVYKSLTWEAYQVSCSVLDLLQDLVFSRRTNTLCGWTSAEHQLTEASLVQHV